MLVFGALFVGSYLLAVADGVPAFDAKQTCRGTEAAGIFPGRNLDSCIRSEQTRGRFAPIRPIRRSTPERPARGARSADGSTSSQQPRRFSCHRR